MNYELLGNIIDVSKGKKHKTVASPSLNAKRIIGINDLRNDNTIVFTDDTNGIEACEKDILIAWDGANAGTIGYGKKGFIGSTISRLRIKNRKEYSEIFLGKLLQSKFEYLRATATGATIPHINRAALDLIKVPHFDLPHQIRIAAVLTRLEALIVKRKESIEALDELLKSTFVEMFLDASINENEFAISPLSAFIIHLTSGGRGWSQYYASSGDRFIRSLDVQMNKITKEDVVYVNPPKGKESDRTRVSAGDVLLTITGSCIGRVAYVPDNFGVAYVSQHVAIIRTQGINPVYLSFYLSMPNFGQKLIRKQQYGQTKPGLNLKQIESFPILDAPHTLQDKFATIVKKIECLKSIYEQDLTELENLYGSLSQRAFKGELDLSKVPMEKEKEIKEHHGEIEFTPPMDNKLSALKLYSEAELKKVIQSLKGEPFSFDSLMTVIEKASFEMMPEYEEVKKQIYKMLEGANPFLSQTFDKVKREIVLRVNP